MADEIAGSAGPDKPVESDNMSVESFAAFLAADATDEQPEQVIESEDAEDDPNDEGDELETEGEPEQAEDQNAVDFENLTPEQWDKIAEQLHSDAAKRIGKLTRRAKEAEEKLASQPQQRQKPENPLESPGKVKDERIAAVADIEGLRKEKDLAETLEEWAQALLDEHGGADGSDVIATEQGREFTKKEVIAMRNTARTRLRKDIPAKLEELQHADEIQGAVQQSEEIAKHYVPEIAETDSPVKATYEAFMANPVLAKAIKATPELEIEAKLIMALAARSAEQIKAAQAKGKTPEVKAPGKIPSPKAPAATAAAAPSGKPASKAKQISEAEARFKESHQPDDFAAYINTIV